MKSSLLALAALAFATPAFATTAANPLADGQATLSLKGLDLTTADGQKRLAIRIDQAAIAVCGDRMATLHLGLDSLSRQCRAEVAADVRQQIETRMAMASGTKLRVAAGN